MTSEQIALNIWEVVALLDRVDETPFNQVGKLLDEASAKLVRAAIAADALAKAGAA